MRASFSIAAVLGIAGLLTMFAGEQASATCGWKCRGMVPVPAPVVVPPPRAVFPAPNPIPLPLPGLYSGPPRAYPYYGYSPVYFGGCGVGGGVGNCYWRRDCWYDAFGRRFCSW
jgi:hypothetical protein